jgi:hypothetical protein
MSSTFPKEAPTANAEGLTGTILCSRGKSSRLVNEDLWKLGVVILNGLKNDKNQLFMVDPLLYLSKLNLYILNLKD